MTKKRLLIKNIFIKSFPKKVLRLIPREILRDLIGYESLSPIEQFSSKGYKSFLYSNLDVGVSDLVLVLGGFRGVSMSEYRNLFDCHVIAVEPIPKYASLLRRTFQFDSKVKIFEFAVSDQDGTLELGLEGETTGVNATSTLKLQVQTREISDFLTGLARFPKVIEMNIEGGEYPCLQSLLETGMIENIETLLIQFHRYGISDELSRAQIRISLERSHVCVFEFPWVWERWDRKT